MTPLHDPEPQPGSRLLWALRFHGRAVGALALLLLFLTSVAVGGMYVAPPTYTATASLIATDLEFSADRLPRLAEAIYAQDTVLRDAVGRGSLPWTVDDLRDDHSGVTPLEDNVLVNVDGTARTEDLAVRTANAVAESLVDALNRSGTEATFSVQERATRALEDDLRVAMVLTVLGGLLSTIAGVLGLAALLLALRRPVTRPSEAVSATGVQVLTVVEVPRYARPVLPLHGLDALQRSLFTRGAYITVLTTTMRDADLRTAVAASYALLLGQDAPATLVPAASTSVQTAELVKGTRVGLHDRSQLLPADAGLVVVDGFDHENAAWRESLPDHVAGVIVVPEGTRRDDLALVMDRFVPEDLAGLVFVSRIGSRRRHVRRRRQGQLRTRWTDRLSLGSSARAARQDGPKNVPSAVGALRLTPAHERPMHAPQPAAVTSGEQHGT